MLIGRLGHFADYNLLRVLLLQQDMQEHKR